MMKFVLFLLFGFFVSLSSKLAFWMVSGLGAVLVIFFTCNSLMLVDYYFLTGSLGLDMISYSLVMLSFFICVLMVVSSNSIFFSEHYLYFYYFVYSLMVILVFTFLVFNFLGFYFFFEVSLIPTLLIIMGWGYQPERLQAGVYFLFYTLGASLPLLLVITKLYYNFLSSDFFVGVETGGLSLVGGGLFFLSCMAFMVKMPMFFTHLWLPSAHVEAPVSGSMILAGVLLKLGGYGLYRIFFITGAGLLKLGGYFFGLSILGMAYVGFMCCRLSDIKALVAYSSVAHMGMVICGLVSYFYWGVSGALMMMVAHGVGSSGLFCAVNMYYERSGSRAFFLNSGMISILPIFTLLFFMLCAANMAAPPTLNLLSEVFLMGGMMKFDLLMLLIFPVGSYLGAVFTLFLFSYSQHGKYFEGLSAGSKINVREYGLMLSHLLPVNILILKPEFFLAMF